MGAESEIHFMDAVPPNRTFVPVETQNQPQLQADSNPKSRVVMDLKTQSSTQSIITYSIAAAIFSYFFYHGKSTAYPPPEELPAPNIKEPFYLHYFLLPSLTINVALLIGAKLHQRLRKFTNALFAGVILYVQWKSLNSGTRSSPIGFASGTGIAFAFLQVVDLLLLSDPVEEFARIPVLLDTIELDKKDGKEAKIGKDSPPKEQGFPLHSPLRTCLAWTFELIHSMRLVGWKVPNPKTPNFHHESDPAVYISRSRFLAKHLFALFIMGFTIDFLVWNIRFNDTAYYFPSNFHKSPEYKLTGFSGGDTSFTLNYEAISIFPPGIFPKPVYPAGYDPNLIPYPKYIPPLPHPTPLSSPLYHFIYTASLFTYRFICQAIGIYIPIRASYTLQSILVVLIGLIIHPQPYTIEELSSPHNSSARWFHPLYYPPIKGCFFGPYWGAKGVLGLWSRGWHSLFRRVFSRPGVALAQKLGLHPDTVLAKIIILIGSFTFSGALHYVGILTQVSYHTTPLNGKVEPLPVSGFGRIKCGGWGVFTFFFSQILGVLFEQLVLFVWKKSGLGKKMGYSRWIARLWTLSWFMLTADWFFEEYRWAGVWKTEPTPLSLWGAWVGDKGEFRGWWRWGKRVDRDGGEWGWWEWSGTDVLGGWGIVL